MRIATSWVVLQLTERLISCATSYGTLSVGNQVAVLLGPVILVAQVLRRVKPIIS